MSVEKGVPMIIGFHPKSSSTHAHPAHPTKTETPDRSGRTDLELLGPDPDTTANRIGEVLGSAISPETRSCQISGLPVVYMGGFLWIRENRNNHLPVRIANLTTEAAG